MALFRCGASSSFNRTQLWAQAVTSSGVAAGNVTLSDDMDNYDYLEFKYVISSAASSEAVSLLISVEDFKKTGTENPDFQFGLNGCTSVPYSRACYYVSDTSLYFDEAKSIYSQTNRTADMCVPFEINGVTV